MIDLSLLIFMVVVVPVVLGVGSSVIMRYLKYKERKLELMAQDSEGKAALYAKQIEELEARTRVLERIATDKGSHLADEIEALRLPTRETQQDDKLN